MAARADVLIRSADSHVRAIKKSMAWIHCNSRHPAQLDSRGQSCPRSFLFGRLRLVRRPRTAGTEDGAFDQFRRRIEAERFAAGSPDRTAPDQRGGLADGLLSVTENCLENTAATVAVNPGHR